MNATIEHNFEYHPPVGVEAGLNHRAVRTKAKELALLIDESLPAAAGREKAVAITKCEEAMMWACAGIARHTPAVAVAGASDLLAQGRLGSPVMIQEGQGLPDDIQWMPPGRHDIKPFVNGEPRDVTMEINATLAAQFAGELQTLRGMAAAGQGDVPFIDFNHDDDEASAEVLALYWAGEDPKLGGIRAKVKWSAAGRAALEGRNYRRFSPQWELDPETLGPVGIRVNLGGLVNRAAFRNIQPVVAKNGGAANKNNKTGDINMDRNEFKEMLAEGLKPLTEKVTALEAKAKETTTAATTTAATAQASAADERIVKLITDANKPLMEKITAMETNATNSVKAQAKASVARHVIRGAIAPADTKTIEFWEGAVLANAGAAEDQMSKLPGKTLGRMTNGSAGTSTATAAASGEPEHQFMAKAKDYAKANEIKDPAVAMAAYAGTEEGKELYGQFRQKIVPKK